MLVHYLIVNIEIGGHAKRKELARDHGGPPVTSYRSGTPAPNALPICSPHYLSLSELLSQTSSVGLRKGNSLRLSGRIMMHQCLL